MSVATKQQPAGQRVMNVPNQLTIARLILSLGLFVLIEFEYYLASFFVFAVAAIFAVASLFEIVEWLYAASASPTAGAEFLGSQGDIWDAQKDMLADGLGAILASVLYHLAHRGRLPDPVKAPRAP